MASRAVYVGRDLLQSVAAAGRKFGWSKDECKEIRRRLRDKGRTRVGNLAVAYATQGRRLRIGGRGQTICSSELRRRVRAEEKACASCGKQRTRFEVDHIVPVADGGEDSRENLQLLCRNCHQKKSAEEAIRRDPRVASAAKPISIPGFGDFPSVHAASKATGFDRQVLRRRRDAGTLHELATARSGGAGGLALMKPLWIDGGPQPSRVAAATARGVGVKDIYRRIETSETAWDLTLYRETWRWRQLEKDAIGDGANCSRCGGRATRAVHIETWTDLSISPYTLPIEPVCGNCERLILNLRKAEIKEAEADWVRKCFPTPEPTPRVLAEQRKKYRKLKKSTGRDRRFIGIWRPVIVDGDFFANETEAERFFGASGLDRALRKGKKWLRKTVAFAPPELLAEIEGGGA